MELQVLAISVSDLFLKVPPPLCPLKPFQNLVDKIRVNVYAGPFLPLTYGHGGLLGVSSDHLDGDSGVDERGHGVFDPGPGWVDDAHQTQKG